MSTEDRVAQLEKSFKTLVDLAHSANERMETQMGWINELGAAQARLTEAQERLSAAQADVEVKIAALVDAQIRTEDSLARLAEAQVRTDARLAETDTRLNRLIDVVERHVKTGEAQP